MQMTFPTPAAFESELKNRLSGFSEIQWVHATGSTNTDLVECVKASRGNTSQSDTPGRGALLRGSHQQTAGRGRAGRPWAAAEGASLLFSCAFEVNRRITELAGLSPAIGVATCEVLRALISHPKQASEQRIEQPTEQPPLPQTDKTLTKANRLKLKWPNDIQWGEAKLAGILIESAGLRAASGDTAQSSQVVIGIGLNLRNGAILSAALDRPVADWTEIAGSAQDPIVLVSQIAHAWLHTVNTYAERGFSAFQARFAAVDALAGQGVNTFDQGRLLLTGTAQGVDEQGQLLVNTPTGIVPVFVGDVSVRSQTAQGRKQNT
jgi:BirA family biotin operon repressor/biotin-[acetyl-CoA-carboxylase] ligase